MQGSKKAYIYIAVVCIVILIVGLWYFSSQVARFPESKGYTVSNMADAYSGVNALFAGLAFAGVIITIILQNSDLNESNKELKHTRCNRSGTYRARHVRCSPAVSGH